ncbi:MAG: PAS domain-containing protein [Microthrixaceae bacterium]|nr:PAS domain-containing protein [Acidimicrobiales bacterium]MCB9402826.1 PAS domain-containing protein [Microthrixaceae bacterium]
MLRTAHVRARIAETLHRFGPRSSGAAFATVGDGIELIDQAVVALLGEMSRAATDSARSQSALAALPHGIILADRGGRVIWRNPAAAEFVDARHGAALVEPAVNTVIADSLTGGSARRRVDLFGPPRRVFELRALVLAAPAPSIDRPRADGGDRGGRGEGGEAALGVMVLVDDISEHLRLESVRRDFVANVSHELKTPIGAIGVLSETLVGENDPATVDRLAGRIQIEAFRLARTVDDLLQLGQIEGDASATPEKVLIGQVVEEAVERTAATADLADVSITVFPVPSDLSVVGDRRQLVSALSNLLENAVKYSEGGREVEVTVRRSGNGEGSETGAVVGDLTGTEVSDRDTHQRDTDGPDRVEVEVVDHGIGIPSADLERVFERFYRVDPARSRDTGGTGLGLAIVRHVAQRHGGDVTVRSIEGQGSTFTLSLPSSALEERP